MNSIPEKLSCLYSEISEIAGYLWQKGWAELNAGNISIRLKDIQTADLQHLPASDYMPLPEPVTSLKSQFIIITGTGRRMRDISKAPKEHTMIVQICGEGTTYKILYTAANKEIRPTSELPTHLACHNVLQQIKPQCATILHTHPTDLISFSHHPDMSNEEIINNTLWKMHPETVVFASSGIGYLPYQIPGNAVIANATIQKLHSKNTILWGKHGAFAVGKNLTQAFDVIDVLNKSAYMYLQCKSAGFEPTGLTSEEMEELQIAYKGFGE